MSMHEDVTVAIHREIESLGTAIALSPTSVALAVQRHYSAEPIEPHLQYASLEHLKQLARRALAGRYELDGEENTTHQAEMFSGVLQDRYPVQKQRGIDPTYKLLCELSRGEIDWNIEQLRKAASARLEHADALEAWADGRRAQTTA